MDETQLLERIKDFGADVYAGTFPTLRERIAHTIVEHRIETVIAGRGPDGKAETFSQAFKRLYGQTLPNVPRKTNQRAVR